VNSDNFYGDEILELFLVKFLVGILGHYE